MKMLCFIVLLYVSLNSIVAIRESLRGLESGDVVRTPRRRLSHGVESSVGAIDRLHVLASGHRLSGNPIGHGLRSCIQAIHGYIGYQSGYIEDIEARYGLDAS